MKKILIIIVFLFLVGCSDEYPDYTDDVTITLNITSEVDPIITPSRGEGVYDKTSKVYTLKVQTAATVDISLSYEDYETLTLSFSSTELLQGDITKDVEFIHPQRAKVVLEVLTSAPTKDILIEGYEYTNKGNKFTLILPNRQVNMTLKVSSSGYQSMTVPITPDKLIIGYYETAVILPKNDEILIRYENINNQLTNLIDLNTQEYINPSIVGDQIIYVFKKGTEVTYRDYSRNEEVYLKIEQSMEIFPFGPVVDKYYYVTSKDQGIIHSHNIYFEYENIRYKAKFDSSLKGDDEIFISNIPVGSKILYLDSNTIAYKKTIDETELIVLNKDAFNNPEPFNLKVLLYDISSNTNVNSYKLHDEEYFAIDGYFELDYPVFETHTYFVGNTDLLLQEYIDGEWISTVNVIPKGNGIIFKFEDIDGNLIKFDDLDYLIEEHPFANNFIFENNASVNFEGRLMNYRYKNYLLNMERVEIDGMMYYTIGDPITLKTNEYQFIVFIDSNLEYLNIEIIHNNNWYFYGNPGAYEFNVKKNDDITVRISEYADSKIPITYQSSIKMTDEILKLGFAKFDDKAHHVEEFSSFEVIAGEGIEIINIELSFPYYYIGNDGKFYYLHNFDFIFVEYKIGEETHFASISFDPGTKVYIVE